MRRRFKISRLATSPSTTLGHSADSSTPVLPSLGQQSDGFTYSCLYFCLSLRIAFRKHSFDPRSHIPPSVCCALEGSQPTGDLAGFLELPKLKNHLFPSRRRAGQALICCPLHPTPFLVPLPPPFLPPFLVVFVETGSWDSLFRLCWPQTNRYLTDPRS